MKLCKIISLGNLHGKDIKQSILENVKSWKLLMGMASRSPSNTESKIGINSAEVQLLKPLLHSIQDGYIMTVGPWRSIPYRYWNRNYGIPGGYCNTVHKPNFSIFNHLKLALIKYYESLVMFIMASNPVRKATDCCYYSYSLFGSIWGQCQNISNYFIKASISVVYSPVFF